MEEKSSIATLLDEMGTAKMAVGFPAVSTSELEIVKTIVSLGLSHTQVLGIADLKNRTLMLVSKRI